MNSDIDRTKEFLDSLGILYSHNENSLVFGKSVHGEKYDGFPECDKIDGYNGFYTCFNFDENGKFLTVVVGE